MIEPKRRGRPPGAKNKPKSETAFVTQKDYDYQLPRAGIESWTMAQGTKITFLFRSAFSTPGETRDTFLPPGWPVPQLNDTVRVGGLAGRVQYVEYDYEQGIIKISCA